MAILSVEEATSRAVKLNADRARVIEEVMKLRHEQARLKTEIAQLALDSGDLSILKSVIACW
jgi:hypothetical protein